MLRVLYTRSEFVLTAMHDKPVQTETLTPFVAELVAYVERTASSYASDMRRDRTTHPIPFFGDVLGAEAWRVEVNPSALAEH